MNKRATPRLRPDGRFLLSHPAHLLAFGLGTGLSPKAPGTVGTLLGYVLFALLLPFSATIQWLVLLGGFLLGIWACDRTGRALGVADYGGIVWDEVVAFAAVLYFVPLHWFWWLLAFGLFRLFDIIKPFPIRQVDAAVKGGLGVMLDDVLAAVYSVAVLLVLQEVWRG